MSEAVYTFVKFYNFMSWGGAFDSLFCTGQGVVVHNDCHWGKGFCPFELCPGRGFVKLMAALEADGKDRVRAEMRVAKVHSPDSNGRVF